MSSTATGRGLARRAAIKAEKARRHGAASSPARWGRRTDRLDVARRQQSRLPRRHLRRTARSPMPNRSRPDRWRRRYSPDRNHLRHAEREGGDIRLLEAFAERGSAAAAHDLGHHHRPFGPHPFRADADRVLAFGPPCAAVFDRPQLRARRERDARASRRKSPPPPTRSSAPIPTPACPTRSANTTKAPRRWRRRSANSRADGIVNIVGGCCGSTPEHIRAIADAVARRQAARVSTIAPLMRLSGLEPFTLTSDIPFVNIGERTNVTGSAKFRKLDHRRRLFRRARGRARTGRRRRPDHRHQHGRGPDQLEAR